MYIFFGPLAAADAPINLATDTADVTILGPRDCGSFASAIWMADLNADGCDDLLIADSVRPLSESTGAFFVQFGEPNISSGRVINWREGGTPDLAFCRDEAGFSMSSDAAIGDYDGDGALDLVFNGTDYKNSYQGRGVVYVVRGPFTPAKGMVRDLRDDPAELTVFGYDGSGYGFGEDLALGDLNGDSRDDLVIGNQLATMQDSHGMAAVFWGQELTSAPLVWDTAQKPADVRLFSGDDPRYRSLGGPLQVVDTNDDGTNDLVIGDRMFGPVLYLGALLIVDGARLSRGRVIDLTATPADQTIVGTRNNGLMWDNFMEVVWAPPSIDSGTSLWFSDMDALRDEIVTGEVWHVSGDQLQGESVINLDETEPGHRYYGLQEMGFGRHLLVGSLGEGEGRDVVISSFWFYLEPDVDQYLGALFVFFDQLPAALPADDDTDDDTAPPDDDESPTDDDTTTPPDDDDAADDDDDNDDASGCGCG